MKKVFLMLLAILVCMSLLCSLVACDKDGDNGETGDSKENTENNNGAISKDNWNTMVAAANFENYTLDLQGSMSTYQNGELVVEAYPVHTIYRATKDAVEMVLVFDDEEGEDFSMVLTGEDATTYKLEVSEIFLAILKNYDNFTYDANSKEYTIKDTTINTEVTAIVDGKAASQKTPVTIVVKEGTATVSEDGKIAKLVCDYSQTMTTEGGETMVTGKTTWTFSDYGKTVVKAANASGNSAEDVVEG